MITGTSRRRTPLAAPPPAGTPASARVLAPGPAVPARALDALLDAARGNPSGRWRSGTDIARARNAHGTNTMAQLRAALAGPYDWLEVDVRLRDGQPVTAHGRGDGGAMTLRDWLDVVARTERGVKVDVKDGRALQDTIELLQRSGIADERIIVNVAPARRDVSLADVRDVRRAFPDAIINLDPGPPPYTAAVVRRAVRAARAIGGPIMFPVDVAHASEAAIRALRTAGRVAVWNDPRRSDPGDVGDATRRLRRWGVDGMVDLRRPSRATRRL